MNGPPQGDRSQQVAALLSTGLDLFKRLQRSEEELREHLISGNHHALTEAEGGRQALLEEVARLEKLRAALVPENEDLHSWINREFDAAGCGEMLARLEEIRELLRNIEVLNRVNRVLLKERTRFAREMRETFSPARPVYDRRGRLEKEKTPRNLDRNC